MTETTLRDINHFRIDLSAKIKKAMSDLGWNNTKLAQEYGRYKKNSEYSKGTITPLVSVWAGKEKLATEMLEFLKSKIGERQDEKT